MSTRLDQQLVNRLERTFGAIAEAIEIAAERTAADALEHLADYLNECDATLEGDAKLYAKWVKRGKP